MQKGKFPVIGFVKDPTGVAALYLGKREGKGLVYMGKVGTSWSSGFQPNSEMHVGERPASCPSRRADRRRAASSLIRSDRRRTIGEVRTRSSLAAAVLVTLGVASSAGAGPPGAWSPVSKGVLVSTDEAGLARTPDGVLHVAWQRRGVIATAVWQTRIAPDGRTQGVEPIAPGLSDGGPPALVAAADGALRSFFFVRSRWVGGQPARRLGAGGRRLDGRLGPARAGGRRRRADGRRRGVP